MSIFDTTATSLPTHESIQAVTPRHIHGYFNTLRWKDKSECEYLVNVLRCLSATADKEKQICLAEQVCRCACVLNKSAGHDPIQSTLLPAVTFEILCNGTADMQCLFFSALENIRKDVVFYNTVLKDLFTSVLS